MTEETVSEIEMFVVGLVLDPVSNAPIVVLKDATGDKCLPIWIGVAEATAIASALKHIEMLRPMTHDLLKNILDEFEARVTKVCISSLSENTFYAEIELVEGERIKMIDSRPSDAIALAVRVGCPIFVAEPVLKEAEVTLVQVNTEEMEPAEMDPELESEGQNFAGVEKEKWAEILAEMDPDDFKYKM